MGDSASSFWSQRKSYFFRQSSFPYEFFSFVFCNGTFLKIIWINLLNVLLLWLDSGFCETMVQICLRCSVPNRMTGTFSVVVAKSCVTLFHPLSCSAPGFPVLHHISNFCSWSWWCHSTILSSVALSLPAFNLPSIRVFSNESALCVRWPKYWHFSFSITPSNEYSGLISFSIDWFALFAVQGTLKSLLQYYSLEASILWHSVFFMVQLSHLYLTPGKTISLTTWPLLEKMMSLLFNMVCLGLS